ncbi:VOC family protein [Agathobaculum sp. Marseille-P7918]|uniref:VOC family protein n=1 Tax=Agathobaculum sp. Marseille-P7918 TaxID=2479843 RepID=UPI003563D560
MKELYKGLGHVAIYTVDMEESIAFYEKIGGSVYKRDSVQVPEGEKKLTLVEFGGFLLELVEPPEGELVPAGEGSIPHFAVYVDDLDKAAAAIKAAGIISFMTPEKKVMPETFGGLQNWFFTGPSGEQIELLQML